MQFGEYGLTYPRVAIRGLLVRLLRLESGREEEERTLSVSLWWFYQSNRILFQTIRMLLHVICDLSAIVQRERGAGELDEEKSHELHLSHNS